MRRRSETKRCLLCVGYCPPSGAEVLGGGESEDPQNSFTPVVIKREPGGEGLNMAGAIHCVRLQQQLENIFILRNMLDVPEQWCEETLRGEADLEEVEDCGNPSSWFTVCEQCKETSVAEAWRIYQQIVALEVKMGRVKERVKGRMREEMLKPQNNSWTWRQQYHVHGGGNGGVEGKIRSFVFPELWISGPDVEEAETFEENLNDEDYDIISEVMELDSEEEDDDDDDDEEWLENGKSQVSADPPWEKGSNVTGPFQQKRKRGRPPKNGISKANAFRVKKKRGRPFKNPANALKKSTKLLLGKKRGRVGRPRKNDNAIFEGLDEYGNVKSKKWNWYCCREPQCRAKYTSSEELEAHKRAHEEQSALKDGEKRELDCPHCPFPAMNTEELKLHIEKRHEDNRIFHYSCPKCDFTVQNDFPSFKLHFDESHPPEEGEAEKVSCLSKGYNGNALSSDLPVACPLCLKSCENLRYFSVHQRKMHPEHFGISVESMECSQCGLKFCTQLELQSHINSEHERSSKYVCDECGRGFQFLSRLESHKVKHKSKTAKIYVCHLCGLDYAYKDVLRKHYAQCHPNAKEGEGGNQSSTGAAVTKVEDPMSSLSSTAGEGIGGEFKCRYCEFTCSIRGLLIRHLEKHKQEMGFKCEQCGRCYMNAMGLKRHLKINHGGNSTPCPYCLKTFISVEYMKDHVHKFCKMKKLESQQSTATTALASSTDGANSNPIFTAETIKRASDKDGLYYWVKPPI